MVLSMFDSAVAWLVGEGLTGQWGDQPFSLQPERIEMVTAFASGDGMRIAEVDGRPAGCAALGEPLEYVEPAGEPELYVRWLVVDRAYAGLGVGHALLDHAAEEAAAAGVGLLRLDCYAGGGGRLMAYYESVGFAPASHFTVRDWPGRVMERRVL
ncbi:N-acetyltransferase [Sinosporangium siamense]|uniref:N-acetyltransferase n=1 Tax=Sinosporangium siamense TaxID=1367973 RepID=A0A919VAR5_9ACTN|nr:N-acetyltransferase [Sinosporangium siamense]